jgi:Tir chaperone protein (CesT) family
MKAKGIAMEQHPAVDSLLQAIGRLLGLPDLAWDEQLSCTLSFGDDVHLTLYADDERPDMTIYTLVGELPAQAPSDVWRDLMEANLFGKGTGGAALGYEPDSQWVYLARRLPVEGMTAQQWLEEIQVFVGACRHWQNRWPQLQARASAVGQPGDEPLQAGASVPPPAVSPADFHSRLDSGMLRA